MYCQMHPTGAAKSYVKSVAVHNICLMIKNYQELHNAITIYALAVHGVGVNPTERHKSYKVALINFNKSGV